jgi:hypothetical protein
MNGGALGCLAAEIRRRLYGRSQEHQTLEPVEMKAFFLSRVFPRRGVEWDQRQDSKGESRDPMLGSERVNEWQDKKREKDTRGGKVSGVGAHTTTTEHAESQPCLLLYTGCLESFTRNLRHFS